MIIGRASIRRDGRVLAVGTDRGVVLWDLARGTELAFLPIGNAWHLMFEASGDLLTSGIARRAAVAGSARRGPRGIPHRPAASAALAGGTGGNCRGPIGPDRGPGHTSTMPYVVTPERTIRVGPLDDCR